MGGSVADRFGRKWALILAAILFVIGALVEAFTPGVSILVVGRLLVGLGVGVAAVAAPIYAAELAPANQRGRFISSYQLAITIGIFAAYFVDEALAGAQGWRWMLGLSVVPGVSSCSLPSFPRQNPLVGWSRRAVSRMRGEP